MALPPRHRVDHEPRCVLSIDSAWKREELAESIDAFDDPADHPWRRYLSGTSRCDLGTVIQWLDLEKGPVIFHFRRLNWKEWALVQARSQTNVPASRNLALQLSVVKIEGALENVAPDRGQISDDDMGRIRELAGDDGFAELGNQALCLSQETLEAEKKR